MNWPVISGQTRADSTNPDPLLLGEAASSFCLAKPLQGVSLEHPLRRQSYIPWGSWDAFSGPPFLGLGSLLPWCCLDLFLFFLLF